MEEAETTARLEAKVDRLQHTLDLILKVMVWTVAASAVLMLVPLVGLALVVPSLVSSYSSLLQ